MQSVTAAFTAEEKDSVRSIAQNLLVSWKKQSTVGNRTFTIGVSLIGGDDVIGLTPGVIGNPGNYKYFNESAYVTSLAWERGLNMPLGGFTKAMAEAVLDNTSGRFTPRYMGGNSELFTAILPTRPVIINAGFELDGIEQTIPQFSGQLSKQPAVDKREGEVSLQATDYIDFFQNKYLDHQVMFTGQSTDQILTTLFDSLGLSTSQYDLDQGLNNIPFGMFDKGSRLADVINEVVQAENGNFYQDEEGIFRFENRTHWVSSPHNTVQRIITTAEVLESYAPTESHLINVVEIKSAIMAKQPNQLLFQLAVPLAISEATPTEFFIQFDDPVLELQTLSGYNANTEDDETGSDITDDVAINVDQFAEAAKLTIYNNSGSDGFITQLYVYGRPAKKTADLYVRKQDDSSVTAYQEKPILIENRFIQSKDWANTYSQTLLDQFSDIENLQRIIIRAMPELQLGDLVSWQGRYWRIYDIKSKIDPMVGYVQELTLLQRSIVVYFTIGVSTIGGTDGIAP